jgi:surface antigen
MNSADEVSVCNQRCGEFKPRKISSYTLISAYQGSASARGLPLKDLLLAATTAQNLFATGQVGQQEEWLDNENEMSGKITLTNIFQDQGVSCLDYSQMIHTPTEIRYSQGMACVDQLNIWRIIKETSIDPFRSMPCKTKPCH